MTKRPVWDEHGLAAFRPWQTPPSSTPNDASALLFPTLQTEPKTDTEANSLLSDSTDASPTTAHEAPAPPQTPLEHLDKTLKSLFNASPENASLKYSALEDSVLRGTTLIDRGYARSSLARFVIERYPWSDAKLAARLVLLFASKSLPHRMLEALRFQNGKMQGVTTVCEVRGTPSADLGGCFERARQEAMGEAARVTVLGVSLVDVGSLEWSEASGRTGQGVGGGIGSGSNGGFSSFSHHFALALGREGWRLYQALEMSGLRLDEWLMRVPGGARLRSWEWGETWMESFRRISQGYGPWTPRLNEAYTECFDINLDAFCGEGKPYPPLIPVYRPWVKIQEINDIKVDDICKFEWRVGRS